MNETHDRVLVAYASKMGGTRAIAEAIGAELTAAGLQVTVRAARDVRGSEGFDAVILGSAIYASRWRPEAVKVLKMLAVRAETLRPIPTWLFHSGPCGNNAADPVPAPKKVDAYACRIGAATPVTFGGILDPATATGFLARKMAAGPRAGDFRDFSRIRAFAADIARQLTTPKPATVRS
jgi:menaquinone-dependent protoporphyrinogen oxidase